MVASSPTCWLVQGKLFAHLSFSPGFYPNAALSLRTQSTADASPTTSIHTWCLVSASSLKFSSSSSPLFLKLLSLSSSHVWVKCACTGADGLKSVQHDILIQRKVRSGFIEGTLDIIVSLRFRTFTKVVFQPNHFLVWALLFNGWHLKSTLSW